MKFGWESFGNSVEQRIRGDLIETFKIMKALHITDREKFLC